MNTFPFASTSSEASTYARAPFSRRTHSLQKVQGCTPSRNPEPRADWWARRAGQRASSEGEATGPSPEGIVEETVAAFRTALRRSDDVASPADLRERESKREMSDSLEYFTPAFHRVLDRNDRAEKDAGGTERAEEDDERSLDYLAPAFRRALGEETAAEHTGGSEETEGHSADSFDYFVPAFRRALGVSEASEAEFVDERCDGPGRRGTPHASTQSLDYFEPAFRRALGRGMGRGTEGAHDDEREGGEAVPPLGTVVGGVSEQGHTRLSEELDVATLSRSDPELERLTGWVVASQSRDLVAAERG